MDLPRGWAQAEARRLEPDDEPAICRRCDRCGECDRDPVDCESDAAEEAAERRFEAMREAWD